MAKEPELSAPPSCPNQRHRSANYKVVSKGRRASADGVHQRYFCKSKSGATHSFSIIAPSQVKPTKKPTAPRVVCPESKHKDSKVQSRGTVKTKTGVWAQYRCQRHNGDAHYFRILLSDDGSAHITLTKPPACPEHPKSKVVRNGTYGSGGARRQRYRCEPEDGSTAHHFSPPLTREAVGLAESCSTCDEMLSPHRGTLTAARHTPWSLAGVVQALNNLSLGSSYAAVALDLRAQRRLTLAHLKEAHGVDLTLPESPLPPVLGSWSRQQGRNAWHLGADLVEQYSPLLYAKVEEELIARERRVRAENDAVLEKDPNATLAHPLVYILDEQPVGFTRWSSDRTRYQQAKWSLLVVVEILWHTGKDPLVLPQREPRLRLARAYPRGDAAAWRLVLSELPVRPDFVIADSADAIRSAVNRHYGKGAVGFIPSLYHIHANLRSSLIKLPKGKTRVNGKERLVPHLERAMSGISRAELMKNESDIKAWWDQIIKEANALAPKQTKITQQRKFHERRMIEAIPILKKNPQLPASNAAVESRIRLHLEPFLENRKHRYRNLARTNFLMDLAVCRAQGVFRDLNNVAQIIRQTNEDARGWAPAPRTLADTQPALSSSSQSAPHIYSSLLNVQLISELSAARGIPLTPMKPPLIQKRVPPTGNPKGRPKGSKSKPKQPGAATEGAGARAGAAPKTRGRPKGSKSKTKSGRP